MNLLRFTVHITQLNNCESNRLIMINPQEQEEHVKIQAAIKAGYTFVVMADPRHVFEREDVYHCQIRSRHIPIHTSLLDLLSFHGVSVQTLFHYWREDHALALEFSSIHQAQNVQTSQCDMTALHKAVFNPIASRLSTCLFQWANLSVFSDKQSRCR